jgi:predicted MPP superfamily phosphohydrolase
MSDLHLGRILGRSWLLERVAQVNALRPDLILIAGDLVDSDPGPVESLVPELKQFQARYGTWVVAGNHDFYAGLERSVAIMDQAGFHVLRDRSELVLPGLVLAGVDDLRTARTRDQAVQAVEHALARRPSGAVIYLSHTPVQAEQSASLGAGLMLSGHTHNGQIWPFNHLVRLSTPLVGGRYTVNGMPVLVCRGTGTWGPPMRLWQPGEILHITLRSPEVSHSIKADH